MKFSQKHSNPHALRGFRVQLIFKENIASSGRITQQRFMNIRKLFYCWLFVFFYPVISAYRFPDIGHWNATSNRSSGNAHARTYRTSKIYPWYSPHPGCHRSTHYFKYTLKRCWHRCKLSYQPLCKRKRANRNRQAKCACSFQPSHSAKLIQCLSKFWSNSNSNSRPAATTGRTDWQLGSARFYYTLLTSQTMGWLQSNPFNRKGLDVIKRVQLSPNKITITYNNRNHNFY